MPCVLLGAISSWMEQFVDHPVHRGGEILGAQEIWHRGLQQLDRSDFQRIALHVSADIHAKMIFLVGGFESFHDL